MGRWNRFLGFGVLFTALAVMACGDTPPRPKMLFFKPGVPSPTAPASEKCPYPIGGHILQCKPINPKLEGRRVVIASVYRLGMITIGPEGVECGTDVCFAEDERGTVSLLEGRIDLLRLLLFSDVVGFAEIDGVPFITIIRRRHTTTVETVRDLEVVVIAHNVIEMNDIARFVRGLSR